MGSATDRSLVVVCGKPTSSFSYTTVSPTRMASDEGENAAPLTLTWSGGGENREASGRQQPGDHQDCRRLGAASNG